MNLDSGSANLLSFCTTYHMQGLSDDDDDSMNSQEKETLEK